MVAVFDSEREQISIVHLRSTKSEVVSISHLCVLRKDSRAMYGKEEPFHRLLARIHMFFHRFPFSLSLFIVRSPASILHMPASTSACLVALKPDYLCMVSRQLP